MSLDEIRQQIDAVDTQIKELFLKRMDLSAQVIREKKKTNASVYVPAREAEMIASRIEGVAEDKAPEYEMLLKQIISISRTYQYSQLKLPEHLNHIDGYQGKILIRFSCRQSSDQLSTAVLALKLSGITIQEIHTKAEPEEQISCEIEVLGDFRVELAKGAVLQIYEENEQVSVERIADER